VVFEKDAENLVDGKETQSGSTEHGRVGRQLLETLHKRQLEFFGHVMRRDGLDKLVVTGNIEGTRARGRQRMKYL